MSKSIALTSATRAVVAVIAGLLVIGWIVFSLHVWGMGVLGVTLLVGIAGIIFLAMMLAYLMGKRA